MAPLEEGWFERLLCSSKNCRPQIIWSFHSILPFNPSTPQKKNEVLYNSSPGFEPTTFLIHDLSWDLDRSTTVGRQQIKFLFFKFYLMKRSDAADY